VPVAGGGSNSYQKRIVSLSYFKTHSVISLIPSSTLLQEVAVLEVEGYELRFRLPDSTDLAAIRAGDDAQRARQTLLQRCLLSARRGEGKCPVPASELPEHAISSLEDEMARMDAQSDMQMALDCPSCRNRWSATFDILGFFWNEINAWAQRLLVEVHMLAARYGWRRLPACRRRRHLDAGSIFA